MLSPFLGASSVLSDGTTLPAAAGAPLLRPPIPYCSGPCSSNPSHIPKEEVWDDDSCAPYPWQIPHRKMEFQCNRYQCANGVYYTRSTWTTEGDCTSSAVYDNPCPNDTCGPPE